MYNEPLMPLSSTFKITINYLSLMNKLQVYAVFPLQYQGHLLYAGHIYSFTFYGATQYSSGCKNAESLKQEVTVPIVSNNKTCTVKVSLGRH